MEVARRYDILSDRDIGVSVINVGVNPLVEMEGLIVQSTVDIINLPRPLAFTSTAVVAESPKRVDIDLEEEIQLLRAVSEDLAGSTSEIRSSRPNPDKFVVIDLFTATNQYLSQVSGRVGNIISSSVVTANRQITSTVHNIIQNTSLSNINYYEVGAFLDVDADATDTIIYIADTTKFKTNGFLLIGDEVVRYMRKLSDRFLMVQRGQEGTTAKFWAAGTFIRQIPSPVSIAPGGVAEITSESQLVTVNVARSAENKVQKQIVAPVVTIENESVSRQILLEVQPQLNVESISSIIEESTTIYEVGADVVSSFSVEHKETYVRKYRDQFDAVLGIISFQFEVSETIVNVAVNPTVTALSQITTDAEIITTPPVGIGTITDSVSYNETVVRNELQSIQSQFVVRKEALEVLLVPPPSGVIDGYEEEVFIDDPISTRLNGFVDLLNDYGVVQRDGTVIFVNNSVSGVSSEYIGNYTTTNAGHTISHFEGIFDDGSVGVSGLSILEVDTYYPALTLKDFSERGSSSYTLSGSKFVLMPPSIQNPVAISSSSGSIGGSIIVQDTTYFPDEGYLFTSGGTVVQYTSKTATTFDGCTLYNGPNSINASDELIPFSIS